MAGLVGDRVERGVGDRGVPGRGVLDRGVEERGEMREVGTMLA